MQVWIYSITSVLLVSLISMVGIVTLSMREEKLRKLVVVLVSFAAGALFGDALIHLLPEAFEEIGSNITASLLTISGILLFFVLEKFICWRHCHVVGSEKHLHPVVSMNIIGDMVHNFIDGVLIGASFLVSLPLGLATTLAVILHEIPQEIGDFGVMLHGGLSIKKALLFNFLSGTTAVLGVIMALALGSVARENIFLLLPIAAGGFLYIAGSDLIPELKHETKIAASLMQLFAIIAGIAVMALLLFVE